jgi:hypothetical protein
MRTVQRSRLLFRALVEKLSLIHTPQAGCQPVASDSGTLRLCHKTELLIRPTMARRKKPKKFTAVKAVKALARERVGTPPVERVVPDKKKKKKSQKHKPTLGSLLAEEGS